VVSAPVLHSESPCFILSQEANYPDSLLFFLSVPSGKGTIKL